jgi:polysaccharide export outer membrane protein
MAKLILTIFVIVVANFLPAQQQSSNANVSRGMGATSSMDGNSNLPAGPIGKDDLIGIAVYDAPEQTRSVRVDANGTIRLPMLQKHIQAEGLTPEDLEKSIRLALIDEQLLVDPIVTVSVVEYRSKPINVIGEVKTPVAFQATGTVTLLDAISRAGGLTANAGSEILITSQKPGADSSSPALTKRIPVTDLYEFTDGTLNVTLTGGELIRVPEAGHYYVLGDVRQPGEFQIRTGSGATVLKALTISGGLQPYPKKLGYIYRTEGGSGGKNEIPVELKKIVEHKSPDIALRANDILYIPEATGRKNTMSVARTVGLIGAGLASTLLYIYR